MTSPMSGDVLATAGCSSCCGGRESLRGSMDLPALSRGRAHRPQTAGSPQGRRDPCPGPVEARPNVRWSLGFVRNQFARGRRFRILNIVDAYHKDDPKEGHLGHVIQWADRA